jgi:hypothetical protein
MVMRVGNSLVQRRNDEGCKPEELIRRCQGLAEGPWACTRVRAKITLTKSLLAFSLNKLFNFLSFFKITLNYSKDNTYLCID